MKILETKLLNIKDIIIGDRLAIPTEKAEDPYQCIVRKKGKKYELITGPEVCAILSQKDSKIEAKIVEASDLEAMEMKIGQNSHRKTYMDRGMKKEIAMKVVDVVNSNDTDTEQQDFPPLKKIY